MNKKKRMIDIILGIIDKLKSILKAMASKISQKLNIPSYITLELANMLDKATAIVNDSYKSKDDEDKLCDLYDDIKQVYEDIKNTSNNGKNKVTIEKKMLEKHLSLSNTALDKIKANIKYSADEDLIFRYQTLLRIHRVYIQILEHYIRIAFGGKAISTESYIDYCYSVL